MCTLLTKNSLIKISQQQFQKKYKYIELVDQGSYGVVCKCQDIKTKQIVAAKYLKDDDGLEGFVKQYQIMQQLDHPNILKTLGLYYITSKTQYVLITTFCNKQNLKKCLPQIKQQTQQLKIWICVQLSRAINAMHKKNIMHRDIKPANVLVNNNWEIKLCDFGFGKQDIFGQKTVKIGTPLYRDPNIISGNYTKKCDIYSIGLVFDTIFRGKSVYQGIQPQKFPLQQIYFLNNKRQFTDKLDCCRQMKQLILACLQKDQIKRINSENLLQRIQQIYIKFQPQFKKENQHNIGNQFFNLQNNERKEQKIQKIIRQATTLNTSLEQKRLTEVGSVKQARIQEQQIKKSQSIDIISISPIITQQLNIKKKSTQTQFQNFYLHLLKTNKEIYKNYEKNKNHTKIIHFFLDRKKKIKIMQQLQKIKNIPNRDKKILIYIVLYGYLRMLKVNKLFLTCKDQNKIQNIDGIKISQISQKTIQTCVNFIQKQIEMTKVIIKPILNTLYNDKQFYKQILTNTVINMINEGYEKKFIHIEELQVHQITEQFLNLLFHQRYLGTNEQLRETKEKLKSIQHIF